MKKFIAFTTAILLVPSGGAFAQTEIERDCLSTLKREHPRLLLSSGDITDLSTKLQSDKVLTDWCAKLRGQADKIIDAPVSRYEIPDGKRLLTVSRRVLGRSQTLGLCYLVERDDKYKRRLWKELDAAAHFKDWNPSHFLDTAEMTNAFAVAYDWLYKDWSAAEREAIRTAIINHGLNPGLKVYQRDAGRRRWVESSHNWNQVCNGGMILGALAIADEEPELARQIVAAAVESLPTAMRSYAPDGAWGEGPGYWHYATHYNVLALAALESALGTDFDLAKHPGFDRTGDFPIHIVGPTGKSFNFADGSPSTVRAPELFWLARRFDRLDFAYRQLKFARPEPLDIVWYAQLDKPVPTASPPLDRYFARSEVAVMRSGWDRDAVFVAFKAGDNKFNHSNLDIGTFVLEAGGVRWALDLGKDNYNMPGYFGDKRWTYYRLRAEAHNTLVLNPGLGPDQLPDASARITSFNSAADHAEAVADLTPAYAAEADKVVRRVALIDRRVVEISDTVAAKRPANLWWFMNTAAKITLAEGGQSAILHQDGKQLQVDLQSKPPAVFTIRDARPLPSSPNPPEQAANPRVRKLTIQLSDVMQLKLNVRFQLKEAATAAGSN